MKINYVKTENQTVTVNMNEEIFDEYFCICKDCGELILISKAVLIDDEWYCQNCTTNCDICGRYLRRSDAYHTVDSDYDYCGHCYNNETYRCADCGSRFRYEDDLREIDGRWYCDDCYDAHEPVIQSYHSMKDYGDIVFHGVQDIFGSFLNYENDGSLNYGFEIISHPATLNYHLGLMPKYRKAFEYLLESEMKSHDIGTCGMHIHLDRRYFGEKEDSSIAKLLYIFEKFRPQLMKFSRRTETQSADWCRSRKQNYNTNAGWIKQAVMESKAYTNYQSRYYSVNLTNSETIEIRLWRGSLNPQTFEATLRFTARLAEICKTVRAVELAKMTFEELLGLDKVILAYWNRINNK